MGAGRCREKECGMNVPIVIHFHGLEKSDAMESLIRERCLWLGKHFSRMTHCDVHVAAPNRLSHRGKVVHVKVDVGIPGKKPVIVSAEKDANQPQEAVAETVSAAFACARRQIDETTDKLAKRVRAERGRRRPAISSDAAE